MSSVILWTIAGILTLCCDRVMKISYAMTWVMLMYLLIIRVMGA